MNKNLGNIDRMIRFLLALIVVALYFGNFISGTLAVILFVLAAIFIVTSFVGFCPLYFLFGIRTTRH